MPARAKVVKYEGDGEETYRMVKTEDARLKTKPAGGKVVKYEGDSDPDAPRADGQVGEQRPVTAIEAAARIACRYEAYVAAAATADRGRDRSRTRSRSSRRIRRSPRRRRSSHWMPSSRSSEPAAEPGTHTNRDDRLPIYWRRVTGW